MTASLRGRVAIAALIAALAFGGGVRCAQGHRRDLARAPLPAPLVLLSDACARLGRRAARGGGARAAPPATLERSRAERDSELHAGSDPRRSSHARAVHAGRAVQRGRWRKAARCS